MLLSFILLFSISCKPKQNPTPKYSELVGTWRSINNGSWTYTFTIDSDGNLNFNCELGQRDYPHYNYTGKLADNFDYPFTVELVFSIFSLSCSSYYNSKEKVSKLIPQFKTGTFTFHDASTCTVSVNTIKDDHYDNGKWGWGWTKYDFNDNNPYTKSFKKQ